MCPRMSGWDTRASIPGLGEALVGMKAGEKKRVVLHPDKAYGSIDPAKRKEMPCVRNMPKMIRMSPKQYVGDFHSFPISGKRSPLRLTSKLPLSKFQNSLQSLIVTSLTASVLKKASGQCK